MTTEVTVNGAVIKENDRVVALVSGKWELGEVIGLDSSNVPVYMRTDEGYDFWCEAENVYKYSYRHELGAPVLIIKPIADFEEECPVGSVAYISDESSVDTNHNDNYLTNDNVNNAPMYEEEYRKHIVFIEYDKSLKAYSHDERATILNDQINRIREIRKERMYLQDKIDDLEHERRALIEKEVEAERALTNQITEWLEEE